MSNNEKEKLHPFVAKTLYIAKHGWPGFNVQMRVTIKTKSTQFVPCKSQRTRHIGTILFVKDRIELGEIKLVHMGTKNMIIDFYTNPNSYVSM